ncbi:MAG: protein kinase, partial [Candidatus Riflebacteria bacterium]|nr:protein kinase [Candidatus Riflebacteria bacterium]
MSAAALADASRTVKLGPTPDRYASEAPASLLTELPPGLQNRFEVTGLLGRGGMGIVLRARDRLVEREVAIKLLADKLAPVGVMLQAEAIHQASLEHDNVVRLYEFGIAGPTAYLVMEYVRGETLRSRLARGRPPLSESLCVARDVVRGVQAAHLKGLVHADLKPLNVFLEAGGRAKVADFGLSFRRESRVGSTCGEAPADSDPLHTPFVGAGTAGYMAPEQARGQVPSPMADVYALGVIMHEMLTGQRLFTASDADSIFRIQVAGPPRRPTSVNPGVPSGLDELVMRCLDLQPDARPTVDELLEQVERWVERMARARRHAGAAGFPPHPYKFLEHFEPDDSVIFFGRQAEVSELAALVEAPPVRLVMVFGPCGIGKSSLLRAGLVRALDADRFAPLVVVSGPDPARRLADALLSREGPGPSPAPPDAQPPQGDAPEPTPRLLARALHAWQRATGKVPVVVVDQLEELFTHNLPHSPRVMRFLELINELVEQPGIPLKLVLSFRSEFRGELFAVETRLARHAQIFSVGEMREPALVEAISGPSDIEVYDFSYEKRFPDRLARDILEAVHERGESALPLLQIVCRQLYDRAREERVRVIGSDLYERALGGTRGALQRYVEERLAGDRYGKHAALARQILRALTLRDAGGERYAHARDEDDLLVFPDREAARQTLEHLLADHLVVREENPRGGRTIRLASEVVCPLVDAWGPDVDEAERAARLLSRTARQWVENGRRHEDLLTGGALALVERQEVALRAPVADELALIKASRSARTWRRVLALGVATLVGTIVGGAVYAGLFRPGRVLITSGPPGAQVLLGRRVLGTTPLVWTARPGVHQLTLRKARHSDQPLTVRVSPGGEVSYSPVLPYPHGVLAVSTDPPGARCAISRVSTGSAAGPAGVTHPVTATTPFHTELAAGTYTLTLSAPGCLPGVVSDVVVPENRMLVERVIRLDRDTGWLQVESPFPGSTMVLLQESSGAQAWTATLPARAHELPAGRYLAQISRPGHHQRVQSMEVTRGTTSIYTGWDPPMRRLWRYTPSASLRPTTAAADLDGDGAPEVMAIVGTCTVEAISGKTGQRLFEITVDPTPRQPDSISTLLVADLDGTGQQEGLVGFASGRLVALDLAGRRQLFEVDDQEPGTADPVAVDLDGDRAAEIVTVAEGRLVVRGGKLHRPMWAVDASKNASQIVVADIASDEAPEVVVGASDRVEAFCGRTGRRLWVLDVRVRGKLSAVHLAAGDTTGDGLAEVVILGEQSVLAISGSTGRSLWTHSPLRRATGWASDLDGDGRCEVVAATEQSLVVLDGQTGLIRWSVLKDSPVTDPILADVDGDRLPDILITRGAGQLEAYRGLDGQELWALPAGTHALSRPVVADLDGDTVPDVARTDDEGALVAVSGSPGYVTWAFRMAGRLTWTPAAADLDGDGEPDVVAAVQDAYGAAVQAVSGKTGRQLWRVPFTTGSNPRFALGDLTGAGRVDLVVASEEPGYAVLSGSTGGVLWQDEAKKWPWMFGPTLADLDRDGRSEIVCLRENYEIRENRIVARSGRDGAVLWTSEPVVVGYPTAPQVLDADGDGRPEVAAVVPGPSPVAPGVRSGGASAPAADRSSRSLLALLDGATGKVRRVARKPLPDVPVVAMVCGRVCQNRCPDIVVMLQDGTLEAWSGSSLELAWDTRSTSPTVPPDAAATGTGGLDEERLALADLDLDGSLDV